MQECIKQELVRLFESLQAQTPDNYGATLRNMECLIGLSGFMDDTALELYGDKTTAQPTPMQSPGLPAEAKVTAGAIVEDRSTAEVKGEAKPAVTEPEPAAHPVYDPELIRGKLAALRAAGKDVSQYIRQMGYSKFSEIPKEDLWELVELAEIEL